MEPFACRSGVELLLYPIIEIRNQNFYLPWSRVRHMFAYGVQIKAREEKVTKTILTIRTLHFKNYKIYYTKTLKTGDVFICNAAVRGTPDPPTPARVGIWVGMSPGKGGECPRDVRQNASPGGRECPQMSEREKLPRDFRCHYILYTTGYIQ